MLVFRRLRSVAKRYLLAACVHGLSAYATIMGRPLVRAGKVILHIEAGRFASFAFECSLPRRRRPDWGRWANVA